MSASTTPTDSPRRASDAARLTVTLDLPTPPLPLATAYTLVRLPGWANGMTGSPPVPPRRLAWSSLRWASLITPKSISTPETPCTVPTAAVMSVRSLSRSGHPAAVSSSPTVTTPAASTSTDLTMPRSVMGRRISGSSTVASAARIAPSRVVAGAVMVAMLRRPGRDRPARDRRCGLADSPPAGGHLSGEPRNWHWTPGADECDYRHGYAARLPTP